MPIRRSYASVTDLQNQVRGLEDKLWMTRRALIGLMPEDVRNVLDSYRSRGDEPTNLYAWSRQAAEEIVALARDVEQPLYQGQPLGSPRAFCPLCAAGTSSPYESGFALPEGVTRHLLGTYNCRQCDVFEAAFELARSYRDSPIGPRVDGN